MPVPLAKLEPEVADYLQGLEDRIAVFERAQAPLPLFACTTANMPAAASYLGCVLRNTTLNILAHSDGTNWLREDTGAAI